MINGFKETECRDSAVIFNSTFEQIKKLYKQNPQQAGELAISAIELALTNEISSDDFMIELLLENIKVVNEKNKQKYDTKIKNQNQKKIEDLKLREIAELAAQGYKQAQIGDRLGLSQQVVSYRMGVIRSEFPELLAEEQPLTKIQKIQKIQTYDNDNVNDNVNDTVNVNVNENENDTENENVKSGRFVFDKSPKESLCFTQTLQRKPVNF